MPLARKATRHVELRGEQHAARVGRPPQRHRELVVPGEDAGAVGGEQPWDRQIAADRDQTFGVGATWVGKARWIAGHQDLWLEGAHEASGRRSPATIFG